MGGLKPGGGPPPELVKSVGDGAEDGDVEKRFQVGGFKFQVSGFRFQVSGFGFQVSGFGFQVSGFGFQVSGFKLRFQLLVYPFGDVGIEGFAEGDGEGFPDFIQGGMVS